LHRIIPEVSKTTIHEAVTEKLGHRKFLVQFSEEGRQRSKIAKVIRETAMWQNTNTRRKE
jgi:hypothetical protein